MWGGDAVQKWRRWGNVPGAADAPLVERGPGALGSSSEGRATHVVPLAGLLNSTTPF